MTESETPSPVNYVALGDSTGLGVGAERGGGYVARLFTRIERVRPRSTLINLCVSGATTADLLRDQLPRFLALPAPTFLTLGIGTNDIGREVANEQFARNYEEIIARLRRKTGAPIVVTNVPDIAFAPRVPIYLRDEMRRRIVLFNERIEETARRHNLLVADVYTTSHETIPAHPEFFSDDGFHPSDAGYELWAKTMWLTVKNALGITTESSSDHDH